MSYSQLTGVLRALTKRSDSSKALGGDGFVATRSLCFDVGLNTRTIRRVLDEGVTSGAIERRPTGRGNGYSYRPVALCT